MKLKMIFIIIAGTLITLLVTGWLIARPLTEIHIKRSVTVNTSMREAFDMVRYLNNFPKWSPFLVQDPTQEYWVEGEDGTLGARYHWKGNKGKDVGFQQISKIKEYVFIGMECDIQKPFKAKPTFDYTFTGGDGKVTITQDFTLVSSVVDAFFMAIFGAKTQMEKTNEQGLQLLKKVLEKRL